MEAARSAFIAGMAISGLAVVVLSFLPRVTIAGFDAVADWSAII